ncbi:chorismate lyase [Archaeoglobus sulfaticallidus PM70-1]|uniref:Chorismate lyase n=1 Tax=Archaeoglobus sulfaticallidus PM70-1 TaxID=387631 RepID=N0BBV2_9EURY|nr:chorismate pyruvate-lyase family protein [Archaeoglobus sulfaticallidus]AGK61084.1 chorismate lyase [Archaeoglobus sulfaticallidus PM70-1]
MTSETLISKSLEDFELKPIHRILLTTDGSITTIIEAYTGNRVDVITRDQRIIKAGRYASLLRIDEEDDINFRVVSLISGNRVYAEAVSLTPLKRLEPGFRDDLTRADIPIGRILRKHKIEARRDINWIVVCRFREIWVMNIPDFVKEFSRNIDLGSDEIVLARSYNIIRRGEVLMNITEFFRADMFE